MTYSRYIALGDQTSMDHFPALDAGAAGVAVSLEFDPKAGEVPPLGAASLLHRNDDERWPEFTADDLVTRAPDCVYTNLCTDGATIGDVFADQLEGVELAMEADDDERPGETLITLTVGNNDLLFAVMNRPSATLLASIVRDIGQAYEALVMAIRTRAPDARILLTTIYDPTDGTASADGILDTKGDLPLDQLQALNDAIRALAVRTPNAEVADAYVHFHGHGMSVPVDERWYWRRSIIEPSAIGASELRRIWLELL